MGPMGQTGTGLVPCSGPKILLGYPTRAGNHGCSRTILT